MNKVRKLYRDGYKWVIVAYAGLIIMYVMIFRVFRDSTKSFFDENFGDGFALSLESSLLNDLLVFLVLGIVGSIVSTLISMKMPDEHEFDERINALVNSMYAKKNAKFLEQLKRECGFLLGFNKKLSITIKIEEYNSQEEAYKIVSNLDHIITNACRDISFKPKKPRVIVASDLKIDGRYGYISHLATYDTRTGNIIKPIINNEIKELKDNSVYDESVDIEVPKDTELGWRVYYSIWHKYYTDKSSDKAWFYITVDRYTQNIEIILENKINNSNIVKYDLRHFKRNDGSRFPCIQGKILKKRETYKPKFELNERDRIEVYFYQS